MRMIILYGQGNVGKSYIARKLLPLFEDKGETVRYVCMDLIVGSEKLRPEHWGQYNELIFQSLCNTCDNVLLDFADIDRLCCDVFYNLGDSVCSSVDIFLFQLHPYSAETIIENLKKRWNNTSHIVTNEIKENIRRRHPYIRLVSSAKFDGFGFRSVNTYVLREQNTYLNDIINVLFSDNCEDDDH